MKACLRQRWHEEIWTRQAPDDLTLCPRDDPGGEQCCRRSVDRTGATSGEFVKCTELKAASRKRFVDLRHSERQASGPLRSAAFHCGDALAQVSKNVLADSRHRSRILSKSR
ncbi:hypothetical protein ACVI1T_004515 [Rhizobium redzepovicii]